jgi:hypothetical protein
MKPTFRLNQATVAAYRKAFRDLAAVIGKNDPESLQKLALLSGRRFLKNVVAITAPASGAADSTAKKRGEQAILNDLLRLAIPVKGTTRGKGRQQLASAEELAELHRRSLVRGGGQTGHRVNPRSRKQLLRISQAEFNRVLKPMQALVGWLAAGLNVSAARLGFKLAAWIARHGTKHGLISVKSTASGIKIRIVQNVPYADNVAGYARKWNFALEKEVKALVNQAKAIVKKRTQKTGLKLK